MLAQRNGVWCGPEKIGPCSGLFVSVSSVLRCDLPGYLLKHVGQRDRLGDDPFTVIVTSVGAETSSPSDTW